MWCREKTGEGQVATGDPGKARATVWRGRWCQGAMEVGEVEDLGWSRGGQDDGQTDCVWKVRTRGTKSEF